MRSDGHRSSRVEATRQVVSYLNAPVSRLAAVIDLGPAEVGSPEEVAAIAERMRTGNGASVLEYVRDLDRAFAIPILGVTEYPGLSAEELRRNWVLSTHRRAIFGWFSIRR